MRRISASRPFTSWLRRLRSSSSRLRWSKSGASSWRNLLARDWACSKRVWASRLPCSARATSRRLVCSRCSSRSSSNRPVRSRSLTSSIRPREMALIRLPVSTVINTAVRRGRIPNRLKRALPTRLPSRSPRVESTPPRASRARISSQPVTYVREGPQYPWRLAEALG